MPVRDSRYDTQKASEFGEVQYLLASDASGLNVDELLTRLIERFGEIGFDPGKDHVVMAGPALVVNLAFMVASELCGPVRALIYEGRSQTYVMRVIDIPEAIAEIEERKERLS